MAGSACRQPAGHGVDLVVGHRQPPGVGLERGVAHAHVGHEVEEAGVVVRVDADGGDGEPGLEQAGEDGRSQTSGTDHAEAIRVDGQAYDLSGCGPPGGGGTAPAVGLCSTGGVPVSCRGSEPSHDERRASRARVSIGRSLGGPPVARARVCAPSLGGTLPPCPSTNSAATSAEPPSRSWSATAPGPSARRVTPATCAGCSPRSPSTHRLSTSAAREPRRAAPPAPPAPVAPATDDTIAALDALREEVECCSRCVLHETRTKAVFGEGDPGAELMFVGEAPGYHEDQQGRPFVGQAGKLLEQLLASIGLTREQVYIANVLKSRPPNNRDPQAGGDRRLPAVPLAADRAHPAQGHLHAGQLRHQAADRRADRHHQGARAAAGDGDRRAPAVPVSDLPPGRGAVHAGQPGDAQRGLPAAAGAAGARRAAARRRGGRAAGRGAAGLAAARAPAGAVAGARGRRADARARGRRGRGANAGRCPPPSTPSAGGRGPSRPRRTLSLRPVLRRRPRPSPRPARRPNRSSSASSR